ncbi:DUF2189 domain-containing protein [Aromatoleum aromaticum]|uniref:DUF2189 domain-containing protein n=1 Tax=Aromatoleum aromaticum (strain DSM 19018 / LMG 30748 / EbN1) TaxID=76114 RepID=Q5NZ12_AROAE|nr:DUF2189 domain-containing protein [Aromatoleum aromaticum]NMG55595.1 DUF2189 domain-containing protein [Aromatoleum aromaticum]CAI09702.1 hypothetical protein ebD112 [Aromatoleum aromaticum EbN1]
MNVTRPQPQHIRPVQIATAVSEGLRVFLSAPLISVVYAGTFMLAGVGLLGALVSLGFGPMGLPLIGGFMLIAPGLLAGFFAISRVCRRGRKPGIRDVAAGFVNTPRDLWGLMLVCGFVFAIWMTDAGILYSFMVGDSNSDWSLLLPLSGAVLRFHLGVSIAGGFFALIVFFVTAYAVPLLIERRAGLVVAVNASVRAVFHSFFTNMLWGLILAATIMLSIVIPLLLPVTLPVMAYASESIYRKVFPTGTPTPP